MSAASLPILWANCVNQLKDRVNNRSFWEALEQAHAITIENGILVLGIDAEEYTRASVINQVSMLHTVHEVVRQLFGQSLKVRIIEGVGLVTFCRDLHVFDAPAGAPGLHRSYRVYQRAAASVERAGCRYCDDCAGLRQLDRDRPFCFWRRHSRLGDAGSGHHVFERRAAVVDWYPG